MAKCLTSEDGIKHVKLMVAVGDSSGMLWEIVNCDNNQVVAKFKFKRML